MVKSERVIIFIEVHLKEEKVLNSEVKSRIDVNCIRVRGAP